MVLLRNAFVAGAILASLLVLSCGDDAPPTAMILPDSPESAGSNSAVLVSRNTSALASGQPAGFPATNDAVLIGASPTTEMPNEAIHWDLNRACVHQYYGYYSFFFHFLPGAREVSRSCNQIEYHSDQTGTTLKVKLHGECALDINVSGAVSKDTVISFCYP